MPSLLYRKCMRAEDEGTCSSMAFTAIRLPCLRVSNLCTCSIQTPFTVLLPIQERNLILGLSQSLGVEYPRLITSSSPAIQTLRLPYDASAVLAQTRSCLHFAVITHTTLERSFPRNTALWSFIPHLWSLWWATVAARNP